jgi:hypothetical protein
MNTSTSFIKSAKYSQHQHRSKREEQICEVAATKKVNKKPSCNKTPDTPSSQAIILKHTHLQVHEHHLNNALIIVINFKDAFHKARKLPRKASRSQ